MKYLCSNRSCNPPKRLSTKQYCRGAKRKSPLELLGKTFTSAAASTAMAPAQDTPHTATNKSRSTNYKKEPVVSKRLEDTIK